jgi:hypothetical protein
VPNCQHPQLWFGSGDYYVICRDCHAKWGRLSNDGRREYATVNGTAIGCSPDAANHGFVDDGTGRRRLS